MPSPYTFGTLTASQRIRLARSAQQVAHYEQHGWPLALVRLLNTQPDLSLSEALDGFAIPARKVA